LFLCICQQPIDRRYADPDAPGDLAALQAFSIEPDNLGGLGVQWAGLVVLFADGGALRPWPVFVPSLDPTTFDRMGFFGL
jgi:hypothetical protein